MSTPIFESLKNHFLIAMPSMVDHSFAGTLTLICEHSPEGALGVIVNRPLILTLHDILVQAGIVDSDAPFPHGPDTVYAGGPIAVERGFVLHSGRHRWQSSIAVAEDLQLTSSRDILVAITENSGPEDSLIALGYAGWGGGQLENELSNNIWLTCKAEQDIIFHTPFQYRLDAAAHTLGIDLRLISHDVGHG